MADTSYQEIATSIRRNLRHMSEDLARHTDAEDVDKFFDYINHMDTLAQQIEGIQVILPADAALADQNSERYIAIRNGEEIAASDAYFDARSELLDTIERRRIFEAGFNRGFDAAVLRARAVPDGFVLVPIYPTPDMVTSGAMEVSDYYDDGHDQRHREIARFAYKRMLEAVKPK